MKMTTRFNDSDLHPKTDAQVRGLALTSPFGSLDHSWHASTAESARAEANIES